MYRSKEQNWSPEINLYIYSQLIFNKYATINSVGEEQSFFYQMELGQWNNTCKTMKVDSYQTSYLKINSKWIKELNVRNKTLRRKHKHHFQDLGLSNGFSDAHLRCIWECSKAWTTKEKVDKLNIKVLHFVFK